MGGPSGGNTGGDNRPDRSNPNKKTKSKSYSAPKKNPVAEFIRDGGITGKIIKGVKKQVEISKKKKVERKINDSLNGTPDYQGSVAKKPTKVTTPIGGNDRNDNPPPKIETKKSIEQPKVKSQMDNTEVKSKNITADKTAPTTTEMPTETELTEDEKLIKRKRGRKTKTILSSVTGDNTKATLSRRTLLG